MLVLWEKILTKKNASGEISRESIVSSMSDILSGRVSPDSEKGKQALARLKAASEEDGTNWAIAAAAEGVPLEYILA